MLAYTWQCPRYICIVRGIQSSPTTRIGSKDKCSVSDHSISRRSISWAFRRISVGSKSDFTNAGSSVRRRTVASRFARSMLMVSSRTFGDRERPDKC